MYILKAILKNISGTATEKVLKDNSKFAESLTRKATGMAVVNDATFAEVLKHVTPKQIIDLVPESNLEPVFFELKKDANIDPLLTE